MKTISPVTPLLATLLAALALDARADVVTDWNIKTAELITEARIGTPPAIRLMAFVQTASLAAVNAIPQRHPGAPAAAEAAVDAAIAAAHRATLAKLLPAQKASIDAAYVAALTLVAEGPGKAAGIAIGEKAAADVLAQRLDDGAATPEAYRPHTSAGAYVPTAAAAIPQWPQRKPWLLASAAQFHPAPPPALTSEQWAREYNEVKELGGKTSTRRSVEQTDIARFWDYSLPAIYHGVLRSVAQQPGRDVTRNARLFALAAQAMDDALIGVFEAKYHYNFWRPVTAIRNGDLDGHDATQRDASWSSLIDAPMHPEYPGGAQHPGGHGRRDPESRSRRRADAGARYQQPHRHRQGHDTALGQRRRLRAGGVGGTHLRRHPLPLGGEGRRGDGAAHRRARGAAAAGAAVALRLAGRLGHREDQSPAQHQLGVGQPGRLQRPAVESHVLGVRP